MNEKLFRFACIAVLIAGCSSSGTAPAPTPTPTIAVVTPTNIALGVVNTTISLTVHVQDSLTTRALAGSAVSWVIDQGHGSLQSATTATDQSGNGTNVITLDKKIGPAEVTAALSNGKRVKFTVAGVPGPAAAAQSAVTHLANAAGGIDTIAVVVADQFGNLTDSTPVRFATTTGSVRDSVVKADINGRALTLWTLPTTSGPVSAMATVANVPPVTFATTIAAPPRPPSVQTVRAVSPTGITMSVVGAVVGPFLVHVQDSASGHPIPNARVTWSSQGPVVRGTPTFTTTDASGNAMLNGVGLDHRPGRTIVTATLDNGKASSFQVQTSVGPAANMASTTTTLGTNVGHPDTIGVLVTDFYGNPVGRVSVHFATRNGSVRDSVVTTDTTGHAFTLWTLPAAAGPVSATATVANNSIGRPVSGSPTTFTVTLPAVTALAFQSIAAGGNITGAFDFTCGVTTAGAGFCWGANTNAQLGIGATQLTQPMRAVPTPVAGGLTWSQIVPGEKHACGLTTDGTAYCWGVAAYGGSGVLRGVDSVPTPVATTLKFVSIASSVSASCAISTAGDAWCWGDNSSGQLGGGNVFVQDSAPTPIEVVGGLKYTSIQGSEAHFCAALANPTPATTGLMCWGEQFALGNPDALGSASPDPVSGTTPFIAYTVMSSGGCGIVASGAAYCWGINFTGQLGTGNKVSTNVPDSVIGGHAFSAIAGSVSVGTSVVCALSAPATWCWGYDSYGTLGNGTDLGLPANGSPTPASVQTSVQFSTIAAGGTHVCALEASTGFAYCWGQNNNGALGLGMLGPDVTTPTAVVSPLTAVAKRRQ